MNNLLMLFLSWLLSFIFISYFFYIDTHFFPFGETRRHSALRDPLRRLLSACNGWFQLDTPCPSSSLGQYSTNLGALRSSHHEKRVASSILLAPPDTSLSAQYIRFACPPIVRETTTGLIHCGISTRLCTATRR